MKRPPPRRDRRHRAPKGEGERLREEIMAATDRLLLRTGDSTAVSVRDIAREVGCTPPAIYLHFESKEELVYEVCERHFEELDALVRAEAAEITDPIEALAAMGRAYIRFGIEHPEQYRVCFMSRVDEALAPYLAERLRAVSRLGYVEDTVRRGMETGVIAAGDPYVVACGLWAAVHGLTSLLVAKPFFPWPEVDELVDHLMAVHARGLAGS